MPVEIAGKTIVITGASSGIGEAAAKRLAREGGKICLVARRVEELERIKKEIEDGGDTAWVYPADLSDLAAVEALAKQLEAEHPQIDVLINNAGRSIRRRVVESFDRFHDYQRTMQLNYFATVRLTLALLPRMLEKRSGHIINVSSMSALIPTPFYSAYVGSKGAVDAFSRSIAAELVDKGVYVTVINFPLVKTAMTAPTKVYKYLNQMDPDHAAAWVVKAIEKRPMRITSRLGEAWGAATMILPGPTAQWTGRLFKTMAKRLARRVENEEKTEAE